MADKQYVGSAKAIASKYGESFAISIWPKDIETLIANQNDKWWVNIIMNKRKDEGRYGETHSLTINDWKPTESTVETPKEKPAKEPIRLEDIPFR